MTDDAGDATPASQPDLAGVAAEAVGELDEVRVRRDPAVRGALRYERSGTPFALAADGWLEMRLPEDVAEAATRTPDVTASDRGAGWVRLCSRGADEHAADRARAWLLTAWRHAADGQSAGRSTRSDRAAT